MNKKDKRNPVVRELIEKPPRGGAHEDKSKYSRKEKHKIMVKEVL